MKSLNIAIVISGVLLVSACGSTTSGGAISGGVSGGGTTTPPDTSNASTVEIGSADHTGSTYTVVQDGTTFTMPGGYTSNGQQAWSGSGTYASSYEGTDVLAIGGVQDGTAFAGITGDVVAPTLSEATYTGRYGLNREGSSISRPMSLTADFNAGTIVNTDQETIAIDGMIDGGIITGTVTADGAEAVLLGGFYGTDEVAGAFNGNEIGGVFYGTRD